MKQVFSAPEIQLLRLEMIDVIATSQYVPGEDELPLVPAVL